MAAIQKIRGTNDFFFGEARKLRYIQSIFRHVSEFYGFEEIITPVFEYTELFSRGIGEGTDIVSKEMYSFEDRGGRSITLRPEGTASVVRAFLENSLYAQRKLNKLFYMGSMYRAERPQKGRYREFNQCGVEILGSARPEADAELISLNMLVLQTLELKDLKLYINSVGCPKCKPDYEAALKEHLSSSFDELCESCKTRYDKNVLRILDCKNPQCKELIKGAPAISATLCEECSEHYEGLKAGLSSLDIEYIENPMLVRGLDYYTKTAFEIQDESLGAQNAVCGGGRYDNLVAQFDEKRSTPAVGSAFGVERLMLSVSDESVDPAPETVFVAAFEQTRDKLLWAMEKVRGAGFAALCDYELPSMKSQFKYADKLGASYVLILGPDELQEGYVMLRDMKSGGEKKVALDDIERLAEL